KKNNYLKLFGIVVTLALLGAVWACYPGGSKNVSESDVIFTFYDKAVDFSKIMTYAMPNQVFEREGSEETTDEFDALILSEVEKNMSSLGYVREANPDVNGADALVVVSKTRQTTTSVGWVPGGGWWPWPGWGWGPGYGWWYPYPVVTSFTTGTVFIDMFDPEVVNPGASVDIPAIWTAGMNGLVSSNASTTSSRIVRDIEQAYRQSSYLGR
ncbi:MAG: DUF4136 domain-containing protein, partial [Candidatus Aminicenantes bacterium]|nr:DUF4136 domain-containing protein [Candidatus Aminicenantes bacterium]